MLPHHRSHDYASLIRRWKSQARAHRLRCRVYAEIDDFPLLLIENRQPVDDRPNIYLSAGIHGDEPGSTEGLLAWIETHPEWLRLANFMILPCLNPWGLTNNCRYNASGVDLNRSFHQDVVPSIQSLKQIIATRHHHLAITLHEDFDGQGLYLYEVRPAAEPWGPRLLRSLGRSIPIDPRRTIDGRKTNQPGYLCRSAQDGQIIPGPEALYLQEQGTDHVFTVETPSEFSLDLRISAQVKFLHAAIRRAVTGKWRASR